MGQSLKSETDSLYAIIHNFEEETKESNRRSDQADCDIRDYGKKVHGLEIEFDETCDKLQKATESMEADIMYAMGYNTTKKVCVGLGQTDEEGKKFAKFDDVVSKVEEALKTPDSQGTYADYVE